MKKTLQIANIIALIVTIVINYLSNTGVFNGNTMASVSASYQNLFTPAGYAFSIWGIIYLGLAAFVVYQSKGLFKSGETPSIVPKVGWAFVISCAANSLWVLAWLYDYTGISVIIMTGLFLSLVRIMLNTRMELDLVSFKTVVFEWWPFAIYLGWIAVALIANIAAYLTKIEWGGFGISNVSWTIIMIVTATGLNLFLTWNRALRESAMVGAWALVAIAVSNWNGEQSIVQSAIVAAAILLINNAIHAYVNRGNHFIIPKPFLKKL